jgi:hypothetical protein
MSYAYHRQALRRFGASFRARSWVPDTQGSNPGLQYCPLSGVDSGAPRKLPLMDLGPNTVPSVCDYLQSLYSKTGRAEAFGELSRGVDLGLGIEPGRAGAHPYQYVMLQVLKNYQPLISQ